MQKPEHCTLHTDQFTFHHLLTKASVGTLDIMPKDGTCIMPLKVSDRDKTLVSLLQDWECGFVTWHMTCLF